MTHDNAGTDQRGERRQYVKPFVGDLDVSVTEGKDLPEGVEFTFGSSFNVGPS